MSAWQLPNHDQRQEGQAVTGWHPDDLDDWDFGALEDDEFWDHDPFDGFLAPSDPLPAVNANTYNTIFPPPHHFLAREAPSQAPHGQANAAGIGSAPPLDAQPSVDHRPLADANTNQQGRFGYIVDHLFDLPSPSTPSIPDSDFVSVGESSSESEQEMPPITRRVTARQSSVVDLTSGSSQGTADTSSRRDRKRRAEDAVAGPSKRRAKEAVKPEGIDEIDLSNDPLSAEEELRRRQQEEAIRAQQAAEKDQQPQRIGQRQCIICMENYTNATVTACGHFFCHECLFQALSAGERNSDRGLGSCPVCRKPLSRKKKYDTIPIAFMKREQFAGNQRKRTDLPA